MQFHRGDFERTETHWWRRPGWGPGARQITFHLTFAAAPQLAAAAERHRQLLTAEPALDPVPPQWLHLTMTRVGFVPDVPDEALAEARAEVFAAAGALGRTTLTFDTLFLARESVMLTCATPSWLAELKSAQEQAVQQCFGIEPSGDAFWPHVSLAYFNGEIDEQRLIDGLDTTELHDVHVDRPTLSLIELGRDEQVYTWRPLAELTLGSNA